MGISHINSMSLYLNILKNINKEIYYKHIFNIQAHIKMMQLFSLFIYCTSLYLSYEVISKFFQYTKNCRQNKMKINSSNSKYCSVQQIEITCDESNAIFAIFSTTSRKYQKEVKRLAASRNDNTTCGQRCIFLIVLDNQNNDL